MLFNGLDLGLDEAIIKSLLEKDLQFAKVLLSGVVEIVDAPVLDPLKVAIVTAILTKYTKLSPDEITVLAPIIVNSIDTAGAGIQSTLDNKDK